MSIVYLNDYVPIILNQMYTCILNIVASSRNHSLHSTSAVVNNSLGKYKTLYSIQLMWNYKYKQFHFGPW